MTRRVPSNCPTESSPDLREVLRHTFAWRFALEIDQLPAESERFKAAVDEAIRVFHHSRGVVDALRTLRSHGHGASNENVTRAFQSMVTAAHPTENRPAHEHSPVTPLER